MEKKIERAQPLEGESEVIHRPFLWLLAAVAGDIVSNSLLTVASNSWSAPSPGDFFASVSTFETGLAGDCLLAAVFRVAVIAALLSLVFRLQSFEDSQTRAAEPGGSLNSDIGTPLLPAVESERQLVQRMVFGVEGHGGMGRSTAAAEAVTDEKKREELRTAWKARVDMRKNILTAALFVVLTACQFYVGIKAVSFTFVSLLVQAPLMCSALVWCNLQMWLFRLVVDQ